MNMTEEATAPDNTRGVVVSILVARFHHRAGAVIEYEYPPLPSPLSDLKGQIASLALPDGSHLRSSESGLFSIDDPKLTSKFFGVSCVRQIDSTEIAASNQDASLTRNTVLKALVAILRVPAFGISLEQLDAAVDTLFEAKVLFEPLLFKNVFHCLSRSLPANITAWRLTDPIVAYHSLDARDLVLALKFDLLKVVKAIMLGAKILIHGDQSNRLCSSSDVSRMVMAIVSLLPGQLEEGLLLMKHRVGKTCYSPGCAARNRLSPITAVPCYRPACQASAVISTSTVPLFLDGLCMPYASVPQLKLLESSVSYIAGTTNELLIRHGNSDIQVGLSTLTGKPGKIVYKSKKILTAIKLTNADLRFMDDVINTVEPSAPGTPTVNGQNPKSWHGTSAWIRSQFHKYISKLLNCDMYMQEHPEAMLHPVTDFGKEFYLTWEETAHCLEWRKIIGSVPVHLRSLDYREEKSRIHPASGQFSTRDIALQVKAHSVAAKEIISDVKDRIQSGPAGATINSISNGISSFWSAFDPSKSR